ncbi:TlpA family protein disulfide reductase [Nonomuraea diastatica]|uniref:TlpA family protein disulfide reductase n=1 Tax=Nonomuraea diastatica TaxID=1848329 RepID=A0A4R4WUV1_9ACTN|nr:TlpA disulfide reductase family protein [Nonomuraea diastatica]TDD21523.1 TlpA family protein disulfide reductase [Nonomuraea diastatica]
MPYLVAAVVLVGLLSMVNLLLTVGVIRRLRQQAVRQDFDEPMTRGGLAPGERIPEFAATTTKGEPISGELLGGPAMVGFFSAGCRPCKDLLPLFVERARQTPDAVLAVVTAGSDEDPAPYVEQLAQVASVVSEEPQGPVQSAFKVAGYPTVFLIDADGTVADSDYIMPTTAGS